MTAPDKALIARLNRTPLYEGSGEESDAPDEAAARLTALLAENEALRAEVERKDAALRRVNASLEAYKARTGKIAFDIAIEADRALADARAALSPARKGDV